MTSQPSDGGVVERTMHLSPVPRSAGEARRAVADALAATGRTDLSDTAAVLVSELVTNAIVHAGTAITLTIAATAQGLRVEVTDSSPHVPIQRGYGASATTGRGVTVVQGLAERHGTELISGNGKTVWFELGTTAPPAAPDPVDDDPHEEPTRVPVRLLHVPVVLTSAWQQHADALLRELLLASFDDEGPAPDLAAGQAAAGQAFNVLVEALTPAFAAAGETENVDLVLHLSAAEVEGFRSLDFLLDRASAMAEAGEFLAPTTQPEIRRLRRWICAQVVRQTQRGEAVPWLGISDDEAPAAGRAVEWDAASVLTATQALVAADDTNRILAASPGALELLGWTAEELVGRRIVTLIPRRYREAHIAAFTLHLLTERTSILNRTVAVPALHRDGREIPVNLLVRRENAAPGRAVFVASFEPLS